MSGLVGLIVNPAAGRDIRRLVGHASVVPHHEKTAITRRVLMGLAATGVDTVAYLPDPAGIVASALDGSHLPIKVEPLPLAPTGSATDSARAAHALAERGARALIILGGDGTNRAVAAACGDVPLVPVSTGTNNVFPAMVDGTIAGLAAGVVATGLVDVSSVTQRTKRVEVTCDGVRDFALIDAGACVDVFRGSRAVWDPRKIRALVLSRAEPWSVGLSSIGGQLRAIAADEPAGLYVELGPGVRVRAVLAPGLIQEVQVCRYTVLGLDEEVTLLTGDGIVALDGERELPVRGRATAHVAMRGPLRVDIRKALTEAATRWKSLSCLGPW